MKYQRSTGLPGVPWPVLRADHGALRLLFWRPIAAFIDCGLSAIAGRVNVGLFFIQCASRRKSHPSLWGGFILTMRNKPVASLSRRRTERLW